MSDDLSDAIESTARGPASVRTDAGEVTAQDLGAMIEADKYLAAKNAAAGGQTTTRRGLRFNKLIPPGTV
jgi:hypothetical protein